jgi:lipid-A-disaccharide synthase
MPEQRALKIAIVAGEASGDVLASGFMKQLKKMYPDASFEGIGGKHLMSLGLNSLFDMEELSVMGLAEVLKHLPRLLHIRKSVIQHFTDNPPDIYIGVDAPDFNLAVEAKLKQQGIKTIHYVSPTVWAWREKRIHKIAKATNLVLGIFPFEAHTYEQYKVPYAYVGHTMADSIELKPDRISMRTKFSCVEQAKVIAVLPGSRAREVATLLPEFIATTRALFQLDPAGMADAEILIPAANSMREHQIKTSLVELGMQAFDQTDVGNKSASQPRSEPPICLIYKDNKTSMQYKVSSEPARDMMIAADAVLLASGTATLEAMLCKAPMVVAYKMSKLTHMIMKRLYKPDYFSLPNILANKEIVPELLQEEVNAQNMAEHLLKLLNGDNSNLIAEFERIHKTLQLNADEQAAKAIQSLLPTSA